MCEREREREREGEGEREREREREKHHLSITIIIFSSIIIGISAVVETITPCFSHYRCHYMILLVIKQSSYLWITQFAILVSNLG